MTFLGILYTLFIAPIRLLFEVMFSCANRITENPGLTIISLSLSMNFLILPLYMRADALQEEEKNIEMKLAAGVAHIKKTFKGDERMMMLQTYYRQNGYKPTYVLRGAMSLFLEIPFFIAAYRFLSELPMIRGGSFGPSGDWWYRDQYSADADDSDQCNFYPNFYEGISEENKITALCNGFVFPGFLI